MAFSNSLATSSTIKPNGSIININPTKKNCTWMSLIIKKKKKKTFNVKTKQRVGKRDCRNINLPPKNLFMDDYQCIISSNLNCES